jgi:hypothetical protein
MKETLRRRITVTSSFNGYPRIGWRKDSAHGEGGGGRYSDIRVKNYLDGLLSSFSTFVYRGVHIGARALHVLNLIWFG